MPSLVIHAPEYQLFSEGAKSFEDTFNTGRGEAYALNSTILRQVYPGDTICSGWRVVLLCKDKRRRAEGELIKLEPATKDGGPWYAKNHIRRYNVYVKNFKIVAYRPEALNRNGVAVI
jgi:hypothetical protein